MSLASEPAPTSLSSGHRRHRVARWIAVIMMLATVGLLSVSARLEPGLDGVRVDENLVYRAENPRTCRLDLYRPEGTPPPGGWPVVVAIHGGGWSGGSFHGYGRSVARLARHGLAVASVGYHLSRNDQPGWPQNRDDIRASLVWIRKHAPDYALNPDRIAALGASAGGHLASLLGTDPGSKPDGMPTGVSAVIDFYGPTDLIGLARRSQRPKRGPRSARRTPHHPSGTRRRRLAHPPRFPRRSPDAPDPRHTRPHRAGVTIPKTRPFLTGCGRSAPPDRGRRSRPRIRPPNPLARFCSRNP